MCPTEIETIKDNYYFRHHYHMLKLMLNAFKCEVSDSELDSCANEGVRLIVEADREAQRQLLEYTTRHTHETLKHLLFILMQTEVGHIVHNVGNRQEHLRNYFMWVTLGVVFNVWDRKK